MVSAVGLGSCLPQTVFCLENGSPTLRLQRSVCTAWTKTDSGMRNAEFGRSCMTFPATSHESQELAFSPELLNIQVSLNGARSWHALTNFSRLPPSRSQAVSIIMPITAVLCSSPLQQIGCITNEPSQTLPVALRARPHHHGSCGSWLLAAHDLRDAVAPLPPLGRFTCWMPRIIHPSRKNSRCRH